MLTLYYILLTLFLALALFLMLLVLIQKGRGGGLASAFGGVGGNTAFGGKTGDVLTWATSVVFGVFILLAIGLNLLANREHKLRNPTAIVPGAISPASDVPSAVATPPASPDATDIVLPGGATQPTLSPDTTPATQP